MDDSLTRFDHQVVGALVHLNTAEDSVLAVLCFDMDKRETPKVKEAFARLREAVLRFGERYHLDMGTITRVAKRKITELRGKRERRERRRQNKQEVLKKRETKRAAYLRRKEAREQKETK